MADRVLAGAIKDKLGSSVWCDVVLVSKTQELFRGVREHMDELMERGGGVDGGRKTKGVSASNLQAMRLLLSHSLSRYTVGSLVHACEALRFVVKKRHFTDLACKLRVFVGELCASMICSLSQR